MHDYGEKTRGIAACSEDLTSTETPDVLLGVGNWHVIGMIAFQLMDILTNMKKASNLQKTLVCAKFEKTRLYVFFSKKKS